MSNWRNESGQPLSSISWLGEDVLCDVEAFRQFCQFDLGRERIPGAITLLNFRHLR